jgi:predicted dehydrogenase
MLGWGDFDAIVVALPPKEQTPAVIAALQAGKHVLCEKPFGLDVDDARAMRDSAAANGLIGVVDFQFRFEPGIAELRRRVRDGAVGALRRIDVSWFSAGRSDPHTPWSWQNDAAAGGGVIGAYVSHVVDLVMWISGRPVATAWGRSQVLIESRQDLDGVVRPTTAEDSIDALFTLVDRTVATARVTNCQPAGSGLTIEASGDQGCLTFKHIPPFRHKDASLRLWRAEEEPRDLSLPCIEPKPGEDSRVSAVHQLIAHFCEAVGGSPNMNLPSFDNGLCTQRALQALRRSISSGREITVSDVPDESLSLLPKAVPSD